MPTSVLACHVKRGDLIHFGGRGICPVVDIERTSPGGLVSFWPTRAHGDGCPWDTYTLSARITVYTEWEQLHTIMGDYRPTCDPDTTGNPAPLSGEAS